MHCDSDQLCVGSLFPSLAYYPQNAYAGISLRIIHRHLLCFWNRTQIWNSTVTYWYISRWPIRIESSTGTLGHFRLLALWRPTGTFWKLLNLRFSLVLIVACFSSIFLEVKLKKLRLVGSNDRVMALMIPIFEEITIKPLRWEIPLPSHMNNKTVRLRNHKLTLLTRALLLSQTC